MARRPKTISEKLAKQRKTVASYMKRHPWARNVWTAVLFLGAVYLVYRFIAPVLFE
jgi:predicted MFS family arabinose efflux permease